MSVKIDLSPLIKQQLKTFHGYSEVVRKIDLLVFVVAPVGLGVALALWGPTIRGVGGVLGGVSVFTALLFALLVNVFNVSVKLKRDEALRPEQPLAISIDELFYNVGWSVVVGLVLIVILTAAAVTHSTTAPLSRVWVGLLVAVFAHLLVTVVMALVRMVAAYQAIGDLTPKRALSSASPNQERDDTHNAA